MWWKYIVTWCVLISIYGWLAMWVDKQKARKQKWRISEKHFYLIVSLGGFFGVWLAIWMWKHKNNKWKFKGPVLGIFIMQIILTGILYLLT